MLTLQNLLTAGDTLDFETSVPEYPASDGWTLKGPVVRGGGSRTRTYEGYARGFTVPPLCRSGHSPLHALAA